jgi:hypothetical protein
MAKQDIVDLKKQNIFLIMLVVLFIVLLLPTFVRFYDGNDSLIGSEPYYHFRAAKALIKDGSLNLFSPPDGISDISYYPRDYFFGPYHYVLVYLSGIVSLATASRVAPLLFGLASVLIFNLILRRFFQDAYKRHIVLLVLIINPAFIYAFTVSNPHCAAVFFSLLGFWLFMREGKLSFIASILCFALVSLFSIFNTLLVLLVLLAYTVSERQMQNRFIVTVFILALLSFTKKLGFFYNYTFTPELSIVSDLISDLGGVIGFGVFSIVLAAYGIVTNWKQKSAFLAYFALAVLVILSAFFIGNMANIYLVFFVAVAAGAGFVRLYEMRWSVDIVKNLALLILLCGLVFSTASYLTRLSDMEPDMALMESVEWLGSNTFKDRFVLSDYEIGYLISTVARNPVVTDPFMTSGLEQDFLHKVQDTLFYTRKLNEAKPLFEAYRIQYIFVTPEMKAGKVWSRDDEGLLFLFTSESTFSNVYEKDGYEIWEVINTTVS